MLAVLVYCHERPKVLMQYFTALYAIMLCDWHLAPDTCLSHPCLCYQYLFASFVTVFNIQNQNIRA